MTDTVDLFDLLTKEYTINKPIRLIELFAGYGSQAMALQHLGADFTRYKVVEVDKYAVASYNRVHGTHFPSIDIRTVSGWDLDITAQDDYAYILTYSFPCTDLSLAGQRGGFAKGSNTRSSLLWEVERILTELADLGTLPDVLVMENVPAVRSNNNQSHFQVWLDFLTQLGYSSFVSDLNASDFGVAQNRLRTYVVSLKGSYNYQFPQPIPLTTCMEDVFEPLSAERAYSRIVKAGKAKKLLQELAEQEALSFPLGHGIQSNCTYSKCCEMLGQMGADDHTFESLNRVYDCHALCPTITTCGGGGREPKTVKTAKLHNIDTIKIEKYLHNGKGIFYLTPVECLRLMNVWEADIVKICKGQSDTQAYKQAGNSIVCSVLAGIFSQLGLKGVTPWNDMTAEEQHRVVGVSEKRV